MAEILIEEEEVRGLLRDSAAMIREVQGTARLLGRQREAIVGLSEALRSIISYAEGQDHITAIAKETLAKWGAE